MRLLLGYSSKPFILALVICVTYTFSYLLKTMYVSLFHNNIKVKSNPLFQDLVIAGLNRVFEDIKYDNDREKEINQTDDNFWGIPPELQLYSNRTVTKKRTQTQINIKRKYFLRDFRVKDVNCLELINRTREEVKRAKSIKRARLKDADYIEMTKDCPTFIKDRGYIMNYLTKEEESFPIAYSILMYQNVEQFERLLRAIYRPQNIYCIHVDFKSRETIHNSVSGIASCFDNVFLLRTSVSVKLGGMSVLEPDLKCMNELWSRSKTWKYFINLTGQEFPLRTNYELVKILKAYNGSNDVAATIQKDTERCDKPRAVAPPHGIHVTRGFVHVAVKRDFVDFTLHDERARHILTWMNRSCYVPDEAYFSTLNHNPHLGVKGSFKGHPETSRNRRKPYMARFKNVVESEVYGWKCHGREINGLCVFGTADVRMLSVRKELFAHRFHLDYQPVAYECMEELIYNRTRDEFMGTLAFNASFYSTLGFVLGQG